MEYFLMQKIILVEDDQRLATLVQHFLHQHSFQVRVINNGLDAAEKIINDQPDLVILDVMLPEEDGFTIYRKIKKQFNNPVIFLTARDAAIDQVMGLEMGADDYIVKPVDPHVLLARINLIDRKLSKSPSQLVLQFGQLLIDRNNFQVTLNNQVVDLTSHEFELLWLLANNAGKPQSREHIHPIILGREYDGIDRSVDVRLSRLRKKLLDDAKNPYRIVTVWGKGYMFCPSAWD